MDYTYTLNPQIPIEKYFEEISQIPRESGNEKAISDYIVAFAKSHGLKYFRDEMWNVVVWKAASAGKEAAAPVMLQAHTDMVCAKIAESFHNFLKDPLTLKLQDNILRADGTTLGADDGFGVAYMLAVLADDTLSHPPLECVFTVQEETGTVGAKMLDKSILTAKRMINLDGDQERATFVSCACSDRVVLKETFTPMPTSESAVTLRLDGFSTGTYQGVTHPECGNVIKMAARLLHRLTVCGVSYRLVNWHAGTAENFNPLEGEVTFITNAPRAEVELLLQSEFTLILKEINEAQYNGCLHLQFDVSASEALTPQDSERLVNVLWLMPNNTFHASIEEALTINNIGTVSLEKGTFQVVMSCRSKLGSCEKQLVQHCMTLAQGLGLKVETQVRYSPWPYIEHSPMREMANQTAMELYGYTLEEEVCPGGLEIGYFFTDDDFDAVMLGPDLKHLHTPEEAMDMASFHRVYALLCAMLKQM